VITALNPIAIRFSNRELAPFWGAGLRLMLMAALLGLVMHAMRLELPRGRALRGALRYGALGYGCAVGLTYYGLVHVHAGLGQLMFALVPLATLLLAAAQGQERVRAQALGGAVGALAGVAVLAQAHLDDALPPLSLLALLGSVLCVAQAAVLVRRFPPVHVVTMNALGTLAAAVLVLVPAALVAGDPVVLPRQGSTWAALAFGVAGGSLLFLLYVFVLKRWAASRAAYLFVLAPFLTFVLSARLDDEPLGPTLVVGGGFIVAGVYLGALRQPSNTSPAAASAASTTTSPP
jgi:drug/metabolite transporter (DMT)-like permease